MLEEILFIWVFISLGFVCHLISSSNLFLKTIIAIKIIIPIIVSVKPIVKLAGANL